MLCYILPEDLRPVLRELHDYLGGKVIKGEPKDVVTKVKELIVLESIRRLWVVGDIVCMNFIKYGLSPYVCVVDGRTLRRELAYDLTSVSKYFSRSVNVRNPAGTITEEAISTLSSIDAPTLVLVTGEEDLLGLAAILSAGEDDAVVYGVPPNVGVAVIKVSREVKELCNDLLRRFIVSKC